MQALRDLIQERKGAYVARFRATMRKRLPPGTRLPKTLREATDYGWRVGQLNGYEAGLVHGIELGMHAAHRELLEELSMSDGMLN